MGLLSSLHGPANERATSFVVGDVDPTEAFGATEGPALFAVSVIILILVFVFLFLAQSTETQNQSPIDQLKQKLMPGEDTHAK